MDGIFRKTTIHAVRTQTQNVDSVKTGVTAQADLAAV
jgi:hypothetical protein